MRLDKFLKISRLVKRRTVANDLVTGGHAAINGKPVKPSATVHVGDELTLRFGNRMIRVRIEKILLKAPSIQEADSLYTVLAESTADNLL